MERKPRYQQEETKEKELTSQALLKEEVKSELEKFRELMSRYMSEKLWRMDVSEKIRAYIGTLKDFKIFQLRKKVMIEEDVFTYFYPFCLFNSVFFTGVIFRKNSWFVLCSACIFMAEYTYFLFSFPVEAYHFHRRALSRNQPFAQYLRDSYIEKFPNTWKAQMYQKINKDLEWVNKKPPQFKFTTTQKDQKPQEVVDLTKFSSGIGSVFNKPAQSSAKPPVFNFSSSLPPPTQNQPQLNFSFPKSSGNQLIKSEEEKKDENLNTPTLGSLDKYLSPDEPTEVEELKIERQITFGGEEITPTVPNQNVFSLTKEIQKVQQKQEEQKLSQKPKLVKQPSFSEQNEGEEKKDENKQIEEQKVKEVEKRDIMKEMRKFFNSHRDDKQLNRESISEGIDIIKEFIIQNPFQEYKSELNLDFSKSVNAINTSFISPLDLEELSFSIMNMINEIVKGDWEVKLNFIKVDQLCFFENPQNIDVNKWLPIIERV